MIGNFFQEEKSCRHANEAWFSNKKDKIFAQLILFERRNERIVSKCVVKLNSCVSIVCQIARFIKFKTWYFLYVRSTERVYKELQLSVQNQYFIKIRFRSSFKICYKSKMKFISAINGCHFCSIQINSGRNFACDLRNLLLRLYKNITTRKRPESPLWHCLSKRIATLTQ